MPTTFGIEEEFVLLDPHTLTTVDRPDAVRALATGTSDGTRRGANGTVVTEFFASQVEHATPVCQTMDDALDFRHRLGGWAADAGLVAAGTGTPFRAAPGAAITDGERYTRIGHDVAGLAPAHQINGLHVHVGLPDRDDRVRASNALRAWLPALLALSSNSPFWNAHDTGFDSWRAVHSRRWTTYGIPPRFDSAAHYDDVVASLAGIGATSDPGTVNWNVRLSATHPTVEVRVFDAQLDPWSAVGLAMVARALAEHAPEIPADATVTDAALWHAARHGIRSTLVHPETGRPAPATQVLSALHDVVMPHLSSPAERACVGALLAHASTGATGSAAQRAAAADGEAGLAQLYRSALMHAPRSAVVGAAGAA